MPRPIRSALFIAAALLAAASLTAGSASPPPPASAAGSCKAPKYPGNGYFTSLRVSKTTCAQGQKVALAYYRCRTKKGIKGRCTTPVLKFRCREVRQSIPTEFDAKVTCKRGTAQVIHTYQQNI